LLEGSFAPCFLHLVADCEFNIEKHVGTDHLHSCIIFKGKNHGRQQHGQWMLFDVVDNGFGQLAMEALLLS
jgi:hypothetical protein